MPPLFPPDYPHCPDAPLQSFGPAFAEEIARSLIQVIWQPDDTPVAEADLRAAAGLTMLEAFHARDQMECMLAVQAVALHNMLMDCYARAMHPDTPDSDRFKTRGHIASLTRTQSVLLRDLERKQAKPLTPRPPAAATPPVVRDLPDDTTIRSDGTAGSLNAYVPPPPPPVIPTETALMRALALRPKPYRIVNQPDAEPSPPVEDAPARPIPMTERMFTGDALARFTSARLDPDAPPPAAPLFDDDPAEIEIEVVSDGGDPETKALADSWSEAHPEGKPIRHIRLGSGPGPGRKKPPKS